MGEDGTLRPDEPVSRAGALKILLQAFRIEPASSSIDNPFTDVPVDAWFASYVESAVAAGMISGFGDGTFRPGEPMTRAGAVKILYELLQ